MTREKRAGKIADALLESMIHAPTYIVNWVTNLAVTVTILLLIIGFPFEIELLLSHVP
jgi:hypothetical protein